MIALTQTRTHAAPPLESGDRLSRAEFERRYGCHPEIKKAELVEGVVYVASPVRFGDHAEPHFQVIEWLGHYRRAHPGIRAGDNGTFRADPDNEVQPDVVMFYEQGGAQVDEDDYVTGSPELVVEVAASSASYDLHDKLRVYRRNGVQEYIVWQILEERIDWFRLREGEYVALEADAEGIIRSEIFPGLCLPVAKMLAGDMPAVLAALNKKPDKAVRASKPRRN